MKRDVLGLILSFGYVFLIIGLSKPLEKVGKETSRKFVHVMVSNWWIIAMIFFDSPRYAVIAPAVFVVLNALSYRFNLFSSMERREGRGDLGTVYYAITLVVLSLLTFRNGMAPYIGGIGILIMGWGDGFAAIVGKRYGTRKVTIFGAIRSLQGSIAMFGVSFVVCFVILSIYDPTQALLASVTIAAGATLAEALTPLGFDNLTVPLLSSALYYFLFFQGSP
jgi:phytol kinase